MEGKVFFLREDGENIAKPFNYSPQSDSWDSLSLMETKLGVYGKVLSLGSEAYMVGGDIEPRGFVFHMESPQGPIVKLFSMEARLGVGLFMQDSVLLVFGGRGTVGGATNTVITYDLRNMPANQSDFKTGRKTPMPRARESVQSAQVDGKIYILGGDAIEMDVYDPVLDIWSSAPPLPRYRRRFAVAAANHKLYVIGGIFEGEAAATGDVEEFDPKTGKWRTVPSLLHPRLDLQCVTVGSDIYAIGGIRWETKQISGADFDAPRLDYVEVYSPK